MPAGPELQFSGICIMCFCVEFQTVIVHRNAFNVCARLQAYVCILAVIHLFIKCIIYTRQFVLLPKPIIQTCYRSDTSDKDAI